MNRKKVLTFLAILLIPTVFAIAYFGQVQRTVTLVSGIEFVGDNAADVDVIGGENVFSNDLNINSITSVVAPIDIITTHTIEDCTITDTENFLLDNLDGTCLPYPSETCEKRIYIDAHDLEIETLSDLNTMEWEANVVDGYLPHVDVLIDTDSDGVADDALVFEYDKVDDGCGDGTPYPTGEFNTFDDKGSISDSSWAWLSSGAAGNCPGDVGYTVKILTDWKILDYEVIGFEIEIDNWISNSNSVIKNIKVNSEAVEISLKPSGKLSFNVESKYGLLCVGEDTITTTVTERN